MTHELTKEPTTAGLTPQRPTLARDEPLSMLVSFHEGRRQLPIVKLERAA